MTRAYFTSATIIIADWQLLFVFDAAATTLDRITLETLPFVPSFLTTNPSSSFVPNYNFSNSSIRFIDQISLSTYSRTVQIVRSKKLKMKENLLYFGEIYCFKDKRGRKKRKNRMNLLISIYVHRIPYIVYRAQRVASNWREIPKFSPCPSYNNWQLCHPILANNAICGSEIKERVNYEIPCVIPYFYSIYISTTLVPSSNLQFLRLANCWKKRKNVFDPQKKDLNSWFYEADRNSFCKKPDSETRQANK